MGKSKKTNPHQSKKGNKMMFVVTPSPLIYLNGLARTPEKREAFFEMVKKNHCAVVNVSDTLCAIPDFQSHGIPAYWFPIIEFGRWGYSPFFATLQVVLFHYDQKRSILIHCHQGAHRSPIVAYTILRAFGRDADEAEKELEYDGLTGHFNRDLDKGRIPSNIIDFLGKSIKNPTMSIKDILSLMGISTIYDRGQDDVVKLTYDVHKLTRGLE